MVFLRRIVINNFKSISRAEIRPGQLTFLVGQNGAGKSNCLDAIRFIADALRTSLDHAMRERGGIGEVRRRSGGNPTHFSISLEFDLPDELTGSYSFKIGAKTGGGFEVQSEELKLEHSNPLFNAMGKGGVFKVKSGKVEECSAMTPPQASSDSLYLVRVSGMSEFAPAFSALSRMEVYNLNPRSIATMQPPDAGVLLRKDGANAASILNKLPEKTHRRISEYLKDIVPGVSEPESKQFGSLETVEFRQVVKGAKAPWKFLASSMSDGTLRAFGVLLALFQSHGKSDAPLIVGLEEPESALHPAAAKTLLRALMQASRDTQIIVTSHSPELLDNDEITDAQVFAVENEEGVTFVGAIDQASRQMLKDNLCTVGQLLRDNQIRADKSLHQTTFEVER